MKKQFDLSIDHAMLKMAKMAFDECLKQMVNRAIATRSMEGKATLTIAMEIEDAEDKDTGEIIREPRIKFKAGFAVPLKESIDGKIAEHSRLERDPEGNWQMINSQIRMDELLEAGEEIKES